MKPRRSATIGLALLAAAIFGWLAVRSHPSPPATGQPDGTPIPQLTTPPTAAGNAAPQDATTASAPSRATPTVFSTRTTPNTARTPPPPTSSTPFATMPADEQTETASLNAIKVRRMVTDYHTLYGENPVGTNAEIMAAVMGKNPREALLGPPEGMGLNSKGELVDEWGTPYFFHQLSRDRMEIHSAGPDRILGTSDDIVVR